MKIPPYRHILYYFRTTESSLKAGAGEFSIIIGWYPSKSSLLEKLKLREKLGELQNTCNNEKENNFPFKAGWNFKKTKLIYTTEKIVTVHTRWLPMVWQIEEETWASTVCNKIYNFHFSAY